MIHYLSKQIDALEKEMTDLIKTDKKMIKLYNLIISVKGVGFVVASNILVMTNCFTSFKDSRKFACFAGIAPFDKQSGTSLKMKSKVSHYANKKMKSLLNLSASSAILADPELKAYYQRRVEEGKSKMSTLNIVRNKIVHRIFAVVQRGTPYVPLYKHAV
jgi:transposase